MSESLSLEAILASAEQELAQIAQAQDELRAEIAALDENAKKWKAIVRSLNATPAAAKEKKSSRPWKIPDEKLAVYEAEMRSHFQGNEFTTKEVQQIGVLADFSRGYTDKVVTSLREMGVLRLTGRTTVNGTGYANLYRFTNITLIPAEVAEDAPAPQLQEVH